MLTLLKFLLGLYMVICAFMWMMQRHLIYMPQKNQQSPLEFGLKDFADVRIKSADGTVLQLWRHRAKEGFPTIVFFHGNGGHLGYRAAYFHALAQQGFGVAALSYRGYGASEGAPSEQGFYDDARAALHYVTETKMPPEKIIIYGESIGSGVAVQMATEFKSAGLVLQSPFTSLTDVAASIYRWLPVKLLLRDRFDSLSKITRVQTPLLLMHGELDSIVPAAFGKELFAAANEPKQAVYFPDLDHNNLDIEQMTNAVVAFCHAQGLIAQH